MIAHPAQPSTASADAAQARLDTDIGTLISVRELFYERPTKARREHLSRELAGVIASLETLRLALK